MGAGGTFDPVAPLLSSAPKWKRKLSWWGWANWIYRGRAPRHYRPVQGLGSSVSVVKLIFAFWSSSSAILPLPHSISPCSLFFSSFFLSPCPLSIFSYYSCSSVIAMLLLARYIWKFVLKTATTDSPGPVACLCGGWWRCVFLLRPRTEWGIFAIN